MPAKKPPAISESEVQYRINASISRAFVSLFEESEITSDREKRIAVRFFQEGVNALMLISTDIYHDAKDEGVTE